MLQHLPAYSRRFCLQSSFDNDAHEHLRCDTKPPYIVAAGFAAEGACSGWECHHYVAELRFTQ